MVDRDYLQFRQHNRSFKSLAHLGNAAGKRVTLTGRGNPVVLRASDVGPDFLRVLRVNPVRGRGFLPEGRPDPNVVLLSHQLWTSRFGGNGKTIGNSLTLDGVSYSIVGVMPASFTFRNADLWVRDEIRISSYNVYLLPILGRLKPGVLPQQAQAELVTFAAGLPHEGGANREGFTSRILPLRDLFVADVRKLLLIFSGAVALVFLIACVNFANLLLIRGAGRQPEMAVRAALGASRWQLVRQLIVESTLLSLVGATLGLLLSVVSVRVLLAFLLAGEMSLGNEIHVDMRVLAFTFGLSLVTGLLFGFAPAWQTTRRELREGVSEGGRTVLVRRERLRSSLVTAEIALALILLVGAGLLTKGFLRMRAANPGFQSTNVVAATFDLPRARYQTAEQMQAFDERVLSLLCGAE